MEMLIDSTGPLIWGITPTGNNYLQGNLYHALTVGQSYCVSFYVLMDSGTNAAMNNIGAYLDNGTIDTATYCVTQSEYIPQIVEADDTIITDSVNWTRIEGSFTANGTEIFITIGDFFDSAHTAVQWEVAERFAFRQFFYLVDDVSVIASDAPADAGPDQATSTTGDSVWVGDTLADYLPCYWYSNIGGFWHLIDSNKAGFKAHPDSTTSYVMQLSTCANRNTDTMTVWVFPETVSPVSRRTTLANCQIFPNPATNQLTLAGAAGCEAVFYNMVGEQVRKSYLQTNKEILDIGELQKGIYTLEVTDPATGMRVLKRLVKE
jgi:hypothetical protein